MMQDVTLPSRQPAPLIYSRNGHHIDLESELDSQFQSLFCNQEISRNSDGTGLPKMETRGRQLINDPEGRQIPNAGLIEALMLLARSLGRSCQERNISSPIRRLHEPRYLSQLFYPSVAWFVNLHQRGIIKTNDKENNARLIAEICVAFPYASIRVLSDNSRELIKTEVALRALLPPEIIQTRNLVSTLDTPIRDYPIESPLPRIILSKTLEAAYTDFAVCDIVILLNAYECMSRNALFALAQVDAVFKLFGILPHRKKQPLSPHERKVIHSVFGFQQIDIKSAGPNMTAGLVRRETSLALVAVGSNRNQSRTNHTPLDFPRCYIDHGLRNHRITRICNALTQQIPLTGRPYQEIQTWLQKHRRSKPSVTIIVSHIEHAVQLARLLPEWPVYLDLNNCNLHGFSRSVRRRISSHTSFSDGSRQIVLVDFAKKFRGYTSDIVIWAGGGTDIKLIPDSWMYKLDDCSQKPLLIIDFSDGFNSQAAAWSKRRQMAYRERDIYHVNQIPSNERIVKFFRGVKA